MTHNSVVEKTLIPIAIAILYQEGQFLLQLRDDIPGIAYPGCWGFFGGHIETDEDPETALKRELVEEIGYSPPHVSFFKSYCDQQVIRHVFYAELTVPVEQLTLYEGWDLDLLTAEEIRQGERYSNRAEQTRPLGKIHQQILLEFMEADLIQD